MAAEGNMELDPNAIYKAGFLALAAKLGRVPTTRDSEWLELGNSYSRSYSEEKDARVAEEQKVARTAAGRPEPECPSRKPAPQALSLSRESAPAASEPLSGPGAAGITAGAPSEPELSAIKPGLSEGAVEGDRGPSGGLVGRCIACGLLFERKMQRGRPAYKCEECR